MTSTAPIRIGIIGAGHLGRYHIECMQQIESGSGSAKLVGFYDIDPDRVNSIAEKYQLHAFDNFDDLLAHTDAVCIVTPTQTHHELGMRAIDAGRHVFIEKPLTDDPESSRKLVDRLAAKGLIGRVGHVERYNPAFIAARAAGLKSPMFIEAHRLAPFNIRGLDVPVIMDLMIHDIDIVLATIDAEVDHIEANGVGVAGPSADICNARISFKNGAVANLTASRISLKQMRKLRLFQRDQYIGIDFLNQEVQVVKLFPDEPGDMMAMKLDLPDGERWIAADNPQVSRHNAIEEELKEFIGAIGGQAGAGVTFEEGARAVEVASQITAQIRQHEA
jgi:predicted dehydrogenase